MFAVGQRVSLIRDGGKLGTILEDNGLDTYLVVMDEVDQETGKPRRVGVHGRDMIDPNAPKPPVPGMVTKGGAGDDASEPASSSSPTGEGEKVDNPFAVE